jgi:hypothetical protein
MDSSNIININFIITSVDKMIHSEKIEILNYLKKQKNIKIHTHSDGARINLDLISNEHIKKVCSIIKQQQNIEEKYII